MTGELELTHPRKQAGKFPGSYKELTVNPDDKEPGSTSYQHLIVFPGKIKIAAQRDVPALKQKDCNEEALGGDKALDGDKLVH